MNMVPEHGRGCGSGCLTAIFHRGFVGGAGVRPIWLTVDVIERALGAKLPTGEAAVATEAGEARRCQPMTVAGFTIASESAHRDQTRDSKTQKTLSMGRRRGGGVLRRSTASCWRSSRFSTTRLAFGRRTAKNAATRASRIAITSATFARSLAGVTAQSERSLRYAARAAPPDNSRPIASQTHLSPPQPNARERCRRAWHCYPSIPVPRDEFSEATKRALSDRVSQLCSNPECRASTKGPQMNVSKATSVGQACHIHAAAPGPPPGPRFEPLQTADERRSIDNGIWLCDICAGKIDMDPDRYPPHTLHTWKLDAELQALLALGKPSSPRTGTAVPLDFPRYGFFVAVNESTGIVLSNNSSTSGGEIDLVGRPASHVWLRLFLKFTSPAPTGHVRVCLYPSFGPAQPCDSPTVDISRAPYNGTWQDILGEFCVGRYMTGQVTNSAVGAALTDVVLGYEVTKVD
jgi:hypothetical protein